MTRPDPKETVAAIGLGSNLGDSLTTVRDAWVSLGRVAGVRTLALSPPFRSAPVGMSSEHWFVNAAGLLATPLTPRELLGELLALEIRFGRIRTGQPGHQDRTLDLDLLLFGEVIMDQEHLRLPHPEMVHRLFVLEPLVHLCPDWRHPVLQRTVTEMRDRLKDTDPQQELQRIQWPD